MNNTKRELIQIRNDLDRTTQLIKWSLLIILLMLIIIMGLYSILALDLQPVQVEYLFPVDNWVLFEDGSFILLKKWVGCLPWSICN